MRDWHTDIVDSLESQSVDLSSSTGVNLELQRALDPYREEWDLTVQNMWTDGADVGRSGAIRRYGLDITFNITRPEIEQALKQHGHTASRMIQRRMTGDLGDALSSAYSEGHSIPKIAETLQDEVFPDMRGYEATRVARTEVISGSNAGAHTAYQDAGAPGTKWLATEDSRTRPTHREADGQVVATGRPFIVGGHQARYPGDPTLPPDERINCRCAVAPVFDESKLS